MGKLTGRTAIVTGAAHGIGRGIAEAFAHEGADVAVVDVASEDQAAPVLETIRQSGRKALYVHTDVANEQHVRTMVETVQSTFGHTDILVNNAGIFTQALVEKLSVEDWDRVLAVNLRGTFLCTRFVLPSMLNQGWGRIINIASQLGYIGGTEVAHYSAEQDIVVEQAINEYRPGQQEISIHHAHTVHAADNQIKLRDTVRGVALRHNLLASFSPKPFPEDIGSGCHVHFSLWDTDGQRNLLYDTNEPRGLSSMSAMAILMRTCY